MILKLFGLMEHLTILKIEDSQKAFIYVGFAFHCLLY